MIAQEIHGECWREKRVSGMPEPSSRLAASCLHSTLRMRIADAFVKAPKRIDVGTYKVDGNQMQESPANRKGRFSCKYDAKDEA